MQTLTIFNHETITLDGESFADCEFRDCRLIYRGGPAPNFNDCRFDGCEWRLEDAAAHTLALLKVMWGVGAKAPVQARIKAFTGASR
jgi:hypothetical protein